MPFGQQGFICFYSKEKNGFTFLVEIKLNAMNKLLNKRIYTAIKINEYNLSAYFGKSVFYNYFFFK